MHRKEIFKELEREKQSQRLAQKYRKESDSPKEFRLGGVREKLGQGTGRSKVPEESPAQETKVLPYTLAAELIPVKKIVNGIIYTGDNRYLKIVEVLPVNFLLRSAKEQRFVIQGFLQWLKVAPCRFQIRTLARRADIGRYLEKAREEMEREENELCRRLQEDYMKLLQEVGLKEAISRRFFLILEYDDPEAARAAEAADIAAALENMADTAKRYLGRCGNEVICPEEPTRFTLELIYQMLNRESCADIAFESRINRVAEWYLKEGGESALEGIPVSEYVAPESLDLTHPNYFVMDGLYYACLYVPSGRYRTRTAAGWTALLINAGEGIDVDFFFFRQDKGKSMERIGRNIRINRSKIQDISDTQNGFDDLADSIQSGLYLRSGLSGSEELYYMCLMVTVTAYSEKELMWRVKELRKLLASRDMDALPCYFRQEQAFLSTLPLLNLESCIYERARRNVLTSGVAGCYPFSAYEMSDEDGVLLGVNKANRSLVLVDIFNSRQYSNANITIWGTTGAGKTFLLQLLALRMRRKGIQVFIIAPDKGHEFIRACKNIGGAYIQISPSSPHCINVMEIWKEDNETSAVLDGEVEKSMLAAKIQDLHIFFSLLVPDMSYEEKQLLDEAMVEAYAQKGITHDNESLWIKTGEREMGGTGSAKMHTGHADGGSYKEMPILGDLYSILYEKTETRRIANILNRLVHGSGASFNQQTNVDLDNKYVVLDVSQLSGDLHVVGMFVAITYVWAKAREDRTKPKTVILDELWRLIGAAGNELAAEYVLEIFKVIRGYGGSAIAASQDTNDFLSLEGGKFGKGIMNASKTKIVMNMEHEDALKVQEILHLSDAETSAVTHFERGNGLLSANGTNVTIDFRASEMEKELITTDRKELAKLKEKLIREGKTGDRLV